MPTISMSEKLCTAERKTVRPMTRFHADGDELPGVGRPEELFSVGVTFATVRAEDGFSVGAGVAQPDVVVFHERAPFAIRRSRAGAPGSSTTRFSCWG